MSLLPREGSDPFAFSGSVGRNGDNDRADVIKAQILLANAGHYDLPAPGVPTGWPGGELERALQAFQRDNGLTADGTLLPLDGGGVGDSGAGETLDALRDRLGRQLQGYAAPTPAEVDRFYAAHAAGDDGAAARSDIVTAEQHRQGGAPVGVKRVPDILSDVEPQAPPPKPGQQEAFLPAAVLPLAVRALPLLVPPAIAAGQWMQQQYEKSRNSPLTPAPDLPPVLPSETLPEGERAQDRTPPLQPPQVETAMQGRPAEPSAPDIEELIPPQMKPWIEGLEPFDQELARQLLVVFNNSGGRRGDAATRMGNAELVKAIMEELQQRRPAIGTYAQHTHGARRPKDGGDFDEMREEYIKGRDSGGAVGATWPDITIKYAGPLADGMAEEYLRMFSGQALKSDPKTGVKAERDQIARSDYNWPEQLNAFVPKLRPDLPDGQVSATKLSDYQKTIAEFAADIGARWEELLKSKGKL